MSSLANQRFSTRTLRAALAGTICSIGLVGLSGCEVDSYMDPSVIGRWEKTPTIVPILDRVAAIEDVNGQEPEYADPTDADLVPVAKLYRLGAGDRIEVEIYDVIEPGKPEKYERFIDSRGAIELPQFGQITIGGMTIDDARAAIASVVARLVPDPLVSINPLSQRQQTFTLLGAVNQPGPYFIPAADYRLLEAITAGGVFDTTPQYIYVIRQVQLSDEERGMKTPGTYKEEGRVEPRDTQPPPKTGESLINVLDQLTKPDAPKEQPKQSPNPGILRGSSSPGMLSAQPAVDIEEGASRRQDATPGTPAQPGAQWVYLNGRWMQVTQGQPDFEAVPGAVPLLTQRIIRISLPRLLEGRRELNIVIRPGDVIRIPPPPRGVFYVGGQISRPGIFTFPDQGRMTLQRAIFAGGGLGALAIPERVDLTRVVGPDRQATIRLNARAIFEGTQPDIYIKSDDIINVGTNFWATPLAVIRNGFRASYGFGFLVDRNFDEEVFGLRPSQKRSVFNP